MNRNLVEFERITRTSGDLSYGSSDQKIQSHPFDERNIHPEISAVCLNLFDNGHYTQATFEAMKLIDQEVKSLSGIEESGYSLMMKAFAEKKPIIFLNNFSTQSEKDEQKGYMHIFAGAMSAIRNPRGHDLLIDSIDLCLDHLSFASVLLRRLETRISPSK